MKLLVQRVKEASVEVAGERVGAIGAGLLVLLGISVDSKREEIPRLVKKLVNLRIFRDSEEKMNLSVQDVKGALLIVSQFTLYGDASGGNRPSFVRAMKGAQAEELYEAFVEEARRYPLPVETGRFGADMAVFLVNEGPVTLMIELEPNLQKNV